MTAPFIAPSARKHGVPDDDMLHAYRCAIRRWSYDEGFTMVIGADRAACLLEIGVVYDGGTPMIVHAMPARPHLFR